MPEVVRQKVTVPQLRVGDMLVHCDTVVVGSTRLGDTCEILKREGGELNIKFETSNGQVMLRHDSDCVVMRVMPTHEEAVAMKERREAEMFINEVVKAARLVETRRADLIESATDNHWNRGQTVEKAMAFAIAEQVMSIYTDILEAGWLDREEGPWGMKLAYEKVVETMKGDLLRRLPNMSSSGGYGTHNIFEFKMWEAKAEWVDDRRWQGAFTR